MDLMRPDQRDAAALTLAEAFHEDPLLQILEPNERKRGGVGTWFFSTAVRYGMRWGHVWCDEDASAVAVWFPPESTEMTPGRTLRAGMGALPLKVGVRGALRLMRATSATEPFHKAVAGPHWYLLALGTRPARQGEGLGTALAELGTSQADAAGLPCYLETGTHSNVEFYSKRGFEITGQVDVQRFTLYGMVRQPR